MHEFSLALGIVEIAEREVEKAKAERVTSINLKMGKCSGVEKDSFEFAWPHAVKNSVLEGSIKEIDDIEAKAQCLECESHFTIERLFDPCPKCGSFLKDIYEGKEFYVESLTVI